jgi:hypothetical protein
VLEESEDGVQFQNARWCTRKTTYNSKFLEELRSDNQPFIALGAWGVLGLSMLTKCARLRKLLPLDEPRTKEYARRLWRISQSCMASTRGSLDVIMQFETCQTPRHPARAVPDQRVDIRTCVGGMACHPLFIVETRTIAPTWDYGDVSTHMMWTARTRVKSCSQLPSLLTRTVPERPSAHPV